MKLGTHVRMSDGREGTVVFNSLIGVGIKWGIHHPSPKDFEGTSGGLFDDKVPEEWPWQPDALLRDPWPGWERHGIQPVGAEFEVIKPAPAKGVAP